MNHSNFQTLFRHHFVTTERLLERAAALSDADYFAHPGHGHGSIHDLLFHILRTDTVWRTALVTGRQQNPPKANDFRDLAALREEYVKEKSEWERLLSNYTDAEIEGEVMLTSWDAVTEDTPLWFVLQHILFHGIQHHTEIAQLLTAKGQSPGDIDLIFFDV